MQDRFWGKTRAKKLTYKNFNSRLLNYQQLMFLRMNEQHRSVFVTPSLNLCSCPALSNVTSKNFTLLYLFHSSHNATINTIIVKFLYFLLFVQFGSGKCEFLLRIKSRFHFYRFNNDRGKWSVEKRGWKIQKKAFKKEFTILFRFNIFLSLRRGDNVRYRRWFSGEWSYVQKKKKKKTEYVSISR